MMIDQRCTFSKLHDSRLLHLNLFMYKAALQDTVNTTHVLEQELMTYSYNYTTVNPIQKKKFFIMVPYYHME